MSNFPMPANPKLTDDTDIYAAVYDFIATYALPALDKQNIIRGWQNTSHLPAECNEYAVMSIISHARRGTTVETFNADNIPVDSDGVLTSSELVLCRVQIDCCSDDGDTARRRAQMIEKVARSSVGVQFFRQYGIGCNFAADARDMTFINGANQYVKRWMTEIELSYVSSFSVELPWFDSVNIKRIENVDVHHEP